MQNLDVTQDVSSLFQVITPCGDVRIERADVGAADPLRS